LVALVLPNLLARLKRRRLQAAALPQEQTR
jgi:hypothetical protein